MYEALVGAAASCVTEPGAAQWWGLSPASPALESMLHLALRSLSTACQLAAEQLDSTAGSRAPHTKEQQKAAQMQLLGDQLNPHHQHRANGAVLLLSILVALAEEAADQGRLNLQRLMECAPALIEVVVQMGGRELQPAMCTFKAVLLSRGPTSVAEHAPRLRPDLGQAVFLQVASIQSLVGSEALGIYCIICGLLACSLSPYMATQPVAFRHHSSACSSQGSAGSPLR